MFQFSDPPSAFWNGINWGTEVLAFRGPIPKWYNSISLDIGASLFKIGGHGYTTKQAALNSTEGKRGVVSLKAGEVVTLIVGDGKPWYNDNIGEIDLDIYIVP